MSHIDTLRVYKEYVKVGYSPDQAEAAVQALDYAIDGVATKSDLMLLEKDLKIFFGYLVGGTFLVTLAFPFIIKLIQAGIEKL